MYPFLLTLEDKVKKHKFETLLSYFTFGNWEALSSYFQSCGLLHRYIVAN